MSLYLHVCSEDEWISSCVLYFFLFFTFIVYVLLPGSWLFGHVSSTVPAIRKFHVSQEGSTANYPITIFIIHFYLFLHNMHIWGFLHTSILFFRWRNSPSWDASFYLCTITDIVSITMLSIIQTRSVKGFLLFCYTTPTM